MVTEDIRLDKWLWAARFYRTRALAKKAIEGGKVSVNNQKAKPGRKPQVNDIIELRQGWDIKTVIINELSQHRGGAPEAEKLYAETAESIEKRQLHAEQRKAMSLTQMHPQRKPDKKQRRDIQRFKASQTP